MGLDLSFLGNSIKEKPIHPDEVNPRIRQTILKTLDQIDSIIISDDSIETRKRKLTAFKRQHKESLKKIYHESTFPDNDEYVHLFFTLITGTRVRYLYDKLASDESLLLIEHPFSLKVTIQLCKNNKLSIVDLKNSEDSTISDLEKSEVNEVISIGQEILTVIPQLIALLLTLTDDNNDDKDNNDDISEYDNIKETNEDKRNALTDLSDLINQGPLTWSSLLDKDHDLSASLSLLNRIKINLNVLLMILKHDLNKGHLLNTSHLVNLVNQVKEAFHDETKILGDSS